MKIFYRTDDVVATRSYVGKKKCPECSCILDRPHALLCSRCGAEIPWASGCSGCGRCQRRR